MFDVTGLTANPQGPAYATTAASFTTLLTAAQDPLAELLRGNNYRVDLRVTLGRDPAGPNGKTSVLYRDGELISKGAPRGDNAALVTKATITGRGLLFAIEVNDIKAPVDNHGNIEPGGVLQTLCHEYGVHAAPWGERIKAVFDATDPDLPAAEQALNLAINDDLLGGNQHARLGAGDAGWYNILVELVRATFHADTDLLRQFDEADRRDVESHREVFGGLSLLASVGNPPIESPPNVLNDEAVLVQQPVLDNSELLDVASILGDMSAIQRQAPARGRGRASEGVIRRTQFGHARHAPYPQSQEKGGESSEEDYRDDDFPDDSDSQ